MGNIDLQENTSSPLLIKFKHFQDLLLPVFLVLTILYLYVDFLASKESILYTYKYILQYLVLGYFVLDLIALFLLYDENKQFFRNHWFDIALTVPFFTAFKGLKGLKVLKSAKIGKSLKAVKLSQKIGKIIKKARKLKHKHF